MVLLAFDITKDLFKENFVGFSVKYKSPSGASNFLVNRINFEGDGKLTDSDKPLPEIQVDTRSRNVPSERQESKLRHLQYYVTPDTGPNKGCA